MERVLSYVRDFLEGAPSMICRCTVTVSANIPEVHDKNNIKHNTHKKTSNTTDMMAQVQNAFRNYMSNSPTDEVHEIPPPERLNQMELGINSLGTNIADLNGRVAIKRGELLEEER